MAIAETNVLIFPEIMCMRRGYLGVNDSNEAPATPIFKRRRDTELFLIGVALKQSAMPMPSSVKCMADGAYLVDESELITVASNNDVTLGCTIQGP